MQEIDMPFLISTRAGFDDIVARVAPAGAELRLYPGIASTEEIARLRDAGARVHVLEEAQLPFAEEASTGTTWVERGSAPVRAPPTLAEEQAHQSLHRRLARHAGVFASAALPRLRQREAGGHFMLVPYIGFGNASKLWVKGRVLDEGIYREQSRQDSAWSNLLALYHRLEYG